MLVSVPCNFTFIILQLLPLFKKSLTPILPLPISFFFCDLAEHEQRFFRLERARRAQARTNVKKQEPAAAALAQQAAVESPAGLEEAELVTIIVLSRAAEELTRFQVRRGTLGLEVRRTIAEFIQVPCDAFFQTALLDKHFFLLDDYKVMEDLRVQVGAKPRAG